MLTKFDYGRIMKPEGDNFFLRKSERKLERIQTFGKTMFNCL